MSDSFVCMLTHMIFSTREREPWLSPEVRPRVLAYIAGVLKRIGCPPVIVGGVEDHVHILAYMDAEVAPAAMARKVKSNSSRWLGAEVPGFGGFHWQRGYAAFSVSFSNRDDVARYIARQEEHHRRMTWREELEQFLARHDRPMSREYLE